MKKLLLSAMLLGMSSLTLAAGVADVDATDGMEHQVCDGGATAGKTNVNGGSGAAVNAATAKFTRAGYVIQCSQNVFMSIQEASATLAAVAAGSAKGNQVVGGNSNGGAILPGGAPGNESDAKCTGPNGSCTAANVSTVLQNAVAAGSSS